MKNELVSVIIACFNAEIYINECLESIVSQSYQNIEIIICDDASTDNSLFLLKKWQEKDSRIILLHNSQNVFSASARNACFNIAKGKYLLIQDIDDISKPNRIDILLKNLITNNVDFISSSMATIDDYGNIDYHHLLKHRRFPTKYDFLWNIPFNHPATLFLTERIKKINGYRVSKETRRAEDYDMFMRLYANGARGMNIDESLYLYRTNVANYKRRTFSARIEECYVRYKGFKRLNILMIGLPMIVKPIFVHFIKKIIRIK